MKTKPKNVQYSLCFDVFVDLHKIVYMSGKEQLHVGRPNNAIFQGLHIISALQVHYCLCK